MNAALVVMAAGLGSRYGGVKQIERLGPGGEILMEYAIYDAMRAGFDKLVLIIKPEMLEDVKQLFGDRVARSGLELCYAFQTMEGDYRGVPIPAGRTKPLGTVHAVLCAREYLDRPFAVINADDFYGRGAIEAVGSVLPLLRGAADSAMVAYRLRNTVSPHGTVTRGVCTVEQNLLRGVTETYKIALLPDGSIRDQSAGGEGVPLDPEAPVSMNLWGFHPGTLEIMEDRFLRFLRDLTPEQSGVEFLLPVLMDQLIAEGTVSCRVLNTTERWFGLTYRADRPGVVAELEALHKNGVYPTTLFN